MNDVLENLPIGLHGAVFADDLILWCSEESIGTVRYIIRNGICPADVFSLESRSWNTNFPGIPGYILYILCDKKK